jgi:hypothetical protein
MIDACRVTGAAVSSRVVSRVFRERGPAVVNVRKGARGRASLQDPGLSP